MTHRLLPFTWLLASFLVPYACESGLDCQCAKTPSAPSGAIEQRVASSVEVSRPDSALRSSAAAGRDISAISGAGARRENARELPARAADAEQPGAPTRGPSPLSPGRRFYIGRPTHVASAIVSRESALHVR